MRSRNWIAWGITIGETLLLLAFGIVLGQYWLMLPIWMRSCAAFGLILAIAFVTWRFLKFGAGKKSAYDAGAKTPGVRPSEVAEGAHDP
jgi:hypothetical protein